MACLPEAGLEQTPACVLNVLCVCLCARACMHVCAPNGQWRVGRGKRGTCFSHSDCSVTQRQPQPPLPPAALPFLSLPSCPVQSRDKSPFPLLLPEPGSPCGQLLPTVWESFIFKRHPPCCISLPRSSPLPAQQLCLRLRSLCPLDSRIPELLHLGKG